MTYAGLLLSDLFLNKTIVGISVARTTNQVISALEKFITSYNSQFLYYNKFINIYDDYCQEGYGKFDNNIISTIKEVYRKEGFILDPIYTGKAFYGMCNLIESRNIQNKNILFLHTGGGPIFFDNIYSII